MAVRDCPSVAGKVEHGFTGKPVPKPIHAVDLEIAPSWIGSYAVD